MADKDKKPDETLQRSTPSVATRPVEISLATTYPNPWNKDSEKKSIAANRWSPHTAIFEKVANFPNEIIGKPLIEVATISSLVEFLSKISTKDGSPRPSGSVKRVNLFAHGNPGLIGLRGHIDAKTSQVSFGGKGEIDRRPTTLYNEEPSNAHFRNTWKLDELTLLWLNSCGVGVKLRDSVRRVFCKAGPNKAELWLVVCHGSGGRGGELNAGEGSALMRGIANTFQVTVRAYSEAIWYYPDKHRVLTAIGKGRDTDEGYYCAEGVVFPKSQKRVGTHLMKAMTFDPVSGTDALSRVTCPD